MIKQLPLRAAITLLLALVSGGLIALAYYDGLSRSVELIESEANAQLLAFGTRLATRVKDAYVDGEPSDVPGLLSATANEPHLAHALVADGDGLIVADQSREMLGQNLKQALPAEMRRLVDDVRRTVSASVQFSADRQTISGGFPFYYMPIGAGLSSPAVGIAWVDFDLSETKRLNLAKHMRRVALMSAVVLAAFVIVWLYLMAVTQRLAALSRAVREAVRNDLHASADVGGRDEIGRLGEGLGVMLGEIRNRTRELTGNQRRMQAIVESAMDAVICVNTQRRITLFNQAAEQMFMRRAQDMLGQPLDVLLPPRFREMHRVLIENFATAGVTRRFMGAPTRVSGLRSNGEEFPIEAAIASVVTHDESFLAVVLRDMSERLRQEKERAELEAQLQQSQRIQSLGTLAGGIAHDFNNILTAISGNVRLAIAEARPNDPLLKSLTEIDKAAKRATDLVRQILTFSRPHDAQRETIKPGRAIEDALQFLRPMVPPNVKVHLHLPLDLPNIVADATQVHQVTMNLGLNAVQAIGEEQGQLNVSADSVDVTGAEAKRLQLPRVGRYVRVRFEDTGSGIESEIMGRIFEPFFTTKLVGQGTGLGLSVVHGVMKSHEGAVTVESKPGMGACFTLYFPAASTAQAMVTHAALVAVNRRGEGQTIMYVDDEEALVLLITRMLERFGYRVMGFTDPHAALTAFRERPQAIDALVSDLSMPGYSGFELAREVLRVRPELPVILVTGYIRPKDAEMAKELGVHRLMLKPNTVESLARDLHELFSVQAAAQ